MSRDVILNFTPTGMVPTKKITPHVPVSVAEIVEDVLRAADLGITMVHLHARSEERQEPTYKKEVYARIIEGIRKYCPHMVICVSLSGRNFNEIEKRSDPLNLEANLKPDMGSLTLSSLNFVNSASVNSPETVSALAKMMLDKGIVPELEVFDLGMINYAKYLIKKGLLKPPYYFNLLFGNISSAQSKLSHVSTCLNDLPDESYWSLAGIGDAQFEMNSLSMAIGGGVRVGIEDNIWFDRKSQKLATNEALLKRVHQIANSLERKIMTPEHFREKMKMASGKGEFGRIDLVTAN